MRHYTSQAQTAKLIELGFRWPMSIENVTVYKETGQRGYDDVDVRQSYSIGELIEMLPKEMDCELGYLGLSIENNIYEQPNEWIVTYDGRLQTNSIELVDALYDMIVKLKEERVI